MPKRYLTLLLLPLAAWAEGPWQSFSGDYSLGGESLLVPSADQQPTHMRFRIHGEPARLMYEQIQQPAAEDRCGIDHLTKQAGPLKCDFFTHNNTYACYFGLNINTNEVVPGAIC